MGYRSGLPGDPRRPWLALPVLLLALPAGAAAAEPPWERASPTADPAEVRAAAEALPPPPDHAGFESLLEEVTIRLTSTPGVSASNAPCSACSTRRWPVR
jgi:hypothetical protein